MMAQGRDKVIAIVGCGSIGSALAEYAANELKENIKKVMLFDADKTRSASLSKDVPGTGIAGSIAECAELAGLVIEAAAPTAVPEVLQSCIDAGSDSMIMSIGGIIGRRVLLEEARKKRLRVLMPTGAIAGIDAVKAASIAGINSATLTTRKAPRSIKGAPYLERMGIDVDSITEETVVFEGKAADAIKGFPKNVNVSALLSLAGIGPEKTIVKIVVSPEYKTNSHEIEVKGEAGRVLTRTENVPSPKNPKTSYMAALAAMAALKGHFDTVRLGT